MPEKNLIKKVEQVVPELGNYVLFFGAILFLLLSGRLILFALESRNLFQLIGSIGDDSYYSASLSLAIYLIVLSILSLLSILHRKCGIIKGFTLIACFNLLIIDGALLYVAPRLTADIIQATHELQRLETSYDWTHQQVNSSAKEATEKWDHVQRTYQCCGLLSYDDWSSLRPENMADNIYPISCCPNPEDLTGACEFAKIYKTDCMDSIYAINRRYIRIKAGLIWSNILLAALGCIVIYGRWKKEEPSQNYELTLNTKVVLFIMIAICSIAQCIMISLKD